MHLMEEHFTIQIKEILNRKAEQHIKTALFLLIVNALSEELLFDDRKPSIEELRPANENH